ncbi:unnamed protein product, partial [Rotaria sp. Silwood1]
MALEAPTQPRTIIISGPSGYGDAIMTTGAQSNCFFARFRSDTTREPRPEEENGR